MGGSSNSIYDVAAEKAELEVYKKDSSQASPMKPWEWPIAYYLLIPIIVVFICWFVLLFEHFTKVQNIRFQALYMRIVLVLPLIMSLEYVAACFPWIVPWIEFFIAFIEGYVLYAFLALIVGIGWRHNDAYEVLSNSRFTRGPFSRFRIEWGKFSSGEVALRYWKRIVFQFAIVRPIVNVVIPI